MPSRPPAVLIVDDSATTRAIIKRVIGMSELPVSDILEAADGKAGLEMMESWDIDLVIADLNMPVMDGAEMIARMRKNQKFREIPVLVVSAQPDLERMEQLKRDGVAGYLPKPFTAEDARQLIGPYLAPKPDPLEETAMIHDTLNMTLVESFAESLETMAFMSMDLCDTCSMPDASPGTKIVSVGFHGKGIRGSLSIAAPPGFGSLVASNCGLAEAPDDGEDSLKELANITCGTLLRHRIGGAAGFEMAPPAMTTGVDPASLFAREDSVVFLADGFRVAAHVSTDSPLFEHKEGQS